MGYNASLCGKCDTLSLSAEFEESGDYSSCPSCGGWSLSSDIEYVYTWECYSCHQINSEDTNDECMLCGLSMDASVYLTDNE